jgi:predicted  nucleic acid-binding Zn-ribbon protein
LHQRKKDKPFWNKVFDHKQKVEPSAKEDIERIAEAEESKIPEKDNKELESMEEEIDAAHDEEIDAEEKQEGVLKRFFKKLNFGKKEHAEPEEEHAEEEEEIEQGIPDEEMKEFLKKVHGLITQLPPETLREFKNSPDFELYTKVLKHHNLIK